jgi:adenosine deaminase
MTTCRINRARKFGEETLGVRISMMPDISREMRPVEDSYLIADWAVANRNNGIVSLGLGGPEIGNPPEVFTSTFERVQAAAFPATPHAGETCGPESIWGAIRSLHAIRIGHGVRCIEDPALVDYLREKQIPLEVCPSSNVCLKVVPSLAEHPLPKLLAEGLFVTINSDDPPMFSTNLTEEYLRITKHFGFDSERLKQFQFNAIKASLLPDANKLELTREFTEEFTRLERELL